LPIDPSTLFDANVFYPERGTFAFSDAMLLVGILGMPLIRLGAEPAIVQDVLLLAALSTSAMATYYLARRLGASLVGGILSGLIFGFAPYRFAHIGHLELQWVVWMPLALICLHRISERPTVLRGILLGLCVAAQTLSSIYYGAFLCLFIVLGAILGFVGSRSKIQFVKASLSALAPLLVVVLIYGPPYSRTRSILGARATDEQQRYSATIGDFLRVPPLNTMRGRYSSGVAPDERSLYPGVIPIALAAAALFPPVSMPAAVYAGLGIVAFEGALGTNGHLFPFAQRVIPMLSSLRSPARFGVLVLLSLAILAAIGLTRIEANWPESARFMGAVAVAICLIEYWSAPLPVRPFDTRVSDAHQYLAQQPAGSVVLELPVPTLGSMWLYETTYQLRSIHHWQRLVNGYSAFAPETYRQTLEVLKSFPSTQSISYLRDLGVTFVLINRFYYSEQEFQTLMQRISERQEFWPPRAFGGGDTQIVVAELKKTK
jgi:hypothetical protein